MQIDEAGARAAKIGAGKFFPAPVKSVGKTAKRAANAARTAWWLNRRRAVMNR